MAGRTHKPGAKEKQLASKKSVAKEKELLINKRPLSRVVKEKRSHKVGNVSKLYAQGADGTPVLIGRKRDRAATEETSARFGRPTGSTKAPRGRRPPARLSSPLPSVSSSESEEGELPEEPLVEEDAGSLPSDDDYQDRLSEVSEEEEEQREESEEDENAVADEDLLTDHPLDLIGVVREGKVYLRGPSKFPERKSHGLLDVTSDA